MAQRLRNTRTNTDFFINSSDLKNKTLKGKITRNSVDLNQKQEYIATKIID